MRPCWSRRARPSVPRDRKSTRLNSSHLVISYAVFCLKKKKNTHLNNLALPSSHLLISSALLATLERETPALPQHPAQHRHITNPPSQPPPTPLAVRPY